MDGLRTNPPGRTALRLAVATAAWLVLTAQATTPAVEEGGIRHEIPEPRFAVTVPSSYERLPAVAGGSDLAVAVFVEDGRRPDAAISITIERLGGLLDRADPRPPERNRDAKLLSLSWRTESLSVLVENGLDDGASVRLTAPVPLTPEAIAVVVEGPSERYAELHIVLGRVLAGLEGPVGWRAGEVDRGPPAAAGLLAVLAAVLVVVILVALAPDLRRIRARRRHPPRRPG